MLQRPWGTTEGGGEGDERHDQDNVRKLTAPVEDGLQGLREAG